LVVVSPPGWLSWPFSFPEFLDHRGISRTPATLASPESGLVLRAFDEYLRFGGFPEVANAADERAKGKIMKIGLTKGG